jgi:hypothetical protein
MSSQSYVGTAKRNFKQAVVHLLETEYALVGSGRIAQLLAEDIEELVNQFYPSPQYISSGWMIFTGTKATGGKAYPGQPVSDHELVALSWPVCLPEDVAALAEMPPGLEGQKARRKLLQKRAIRLVEHGLNHRQGSVLLTLADLSVMLGINTVRVSKLLAQARKETGKRLPTAGYYFDQGMRPSHKGDIVDLYEQGLDEAEIAWRTQHAQSSVGRYLRDYERVKLSLRRKIPPSQIAGLTGLQPGVVQAYLKLTHKYHPDLQFDNELSPQGT